MGAGAGMPFARGEERGFTYVWMLFTVAVTGVLLAAAGQLWRTEAQREKEKELMFAGDQLRRAIGSYYESSPGAKRFPPSMEKLLLDDRFPFVRRHLRKIFPDPFTSKPEWGLVTEPGVGIMGVHSLSTQKPIKRANFHERYASFEKAETYKEWKFVYSPGDPEFAALQPQTPRPPQGPPGRPPQGGPQSGLMSGTQQPGPQPQGSVAGESTAVPSVQPGQFPATPDPNPDSLDDPDGPSFGQQQSDSTFPRTFDQR
jgi:type II secretory pathway pseudopilin PulG